MAAGFHGLRSRLAECFDVIQAFCELARAKVMVRLYSTRTFVAAAEPCQPLGDEERALIERVAKAVNRAADILPMRGTCLVRAIAAKNWLRRHGILSTLKIGVSTEGRFEAHAWLLVGSIMVTGASERNYASFVQR